MDVRILLEMRPVHAEEWTTAFSIAEKALESGWRITQTRVTTQQGDNVLIQVEKSGTELLKMFTGKKEEENINGGI